MGQKGQTGTGMDEVAEIQARIKQRLAEKGMSLADLAARILLEDHDEDDALAVARFTDTLKKQLKRPSTPIKKLERYWEILLSDRQGLEGRYPSVTSSLSLLPKQVLDQLHKLSADIDVLLLKK